MSELRSAGSSLEWLLDCSGTFLQGGWSLWAGRSTPCPPWPFAIRSPHSRPSFLAEAPQPFSLLAARLLPSSFLCRTNEWGFLVNVFQTTDIIFNVAGHSEAGNKEKGWGTQRVSRNTKVITLTCNYCFLCKTWIAPLSSGSYSFPLSARIVLFFRKCLNGSNTTQHIPTLSLSSPSN